MPIRARLTLWYAGVLLLILAGVGTFVVVEMRSALRERAHDTLEASFRTVAGELASGRDTGLAAILGARGFPGEDAHEVIGQVLDGAGRVVESSGQPGSRRPMVDRAELATARRSGHWHEPRRLAGREHEDVVVVVPIRSGPRAGEFVVLAQTLEAAEAAVHRLVLLLLLAAPLALALALYGGWRVASALLRPVDDMTRTAAAIDPARSGEQLPVPPRDDELGRLAHTLNDMLSRLRRALERERRFSADTSHELRTPLGLMAAELDVRLASPRTSPDAVPVLRSLREEVSRLEHMVSDLLVLSRADAAGEVELATRSEDVLDLAVATVARFRDAADRQGIDLRIAGEPLAARVDPDLMRHAIGNLVDNALKHSSQGTTVEVLVADGTDPRIEVRDHGAGIRAEDLPHVFDRFYRVDGARDRADGGAGLGLAITRSIVEAHHGRVDAESEPGAGSTFTIHLPA
jgi:heavy metal sensor kinase